MRHFNATFQTLTRFGLAIALTATILTTSAALAQSPGTPAFIENLGQWDAEARFAAQLPDMAVFATDTGFAVTLYERSPASPSHPLADSVARGKPQGGHARQAPGTTRLSNLFFRFEGAASDTVVHGVAPLPGRHAFAKGQDLDNRVQGARGFTGVHYEDLYAGVDLDLKFAGPAVEYDLTLEPGADLDAIVLRVEGAAGLEIDDHGILVASTEVGDLRQIIPATWMENPDGSRTAIKGRFTLLGEHSFGFEVDGRDPARRLVIDPLLVYSSFLGGGVASPTGVTVDESEPNGSAGLADSMAIGDDFSGAITPDTDADFVAITLTAGTTLSATTVLGTLIDSTLTLYDTDGVTELDFNDDYIGFESRIDFAPTVSGTYFLAVESYSNAASGTYTLELRSQATGDDRLLAVTVHEPGDLRYDGGSVSPIVYTAGWTDALDFPTVPGPTALAGDFDATASMVDDSGPTLIASLTFGGFDTDYATSNDVDASGNHYITGATYSTDYPSTDGAYDETFNGPGTEDTFVVKIDPDGQTIHWNTLLGGTGYDEGWGIGAHPVDEQVWVCGVTTSPDFPTTGGALDTSLGGIQDAFVSRLDASGGLLLSSTYHGGADIEWAFDLDLATFTAEKDGLSTEVMVAVTGFTHSTDLYVTGFEFDLTLGGVEDAFVTAFDADLSSPHFSGYLGGTLGTAESGRGIAVSDDGTCFVTGITDASDYPTTGGAFDTTHNGFIDAFVCEVDPWGGTLEWSTFLGGGDNDWSFAIARDSLGGLVVGGETASGDFPVTAGAIDTTHADIGTSTDAFVTQVSAGGDIVSYSTFLGGAGNFDYCLGLALDSSSAIHACGGTWTADFPGDEGGAFDPVYGGVQEGWLAKIEGPWSNLGHALAGSYGEPVLTGEGSLVHGTPINITLSNALENSTCYFVLGASRVDIFPFYGGTLVPIFFSPTGLFLILGTGPTGTLPLAGTWDNTGIPSGFSIYFQYWIEDAGGPFGFSASNAISLTTP